MTPEEIRVSLRWNFPHCAASILRMIEDHVIFEMVKCRNEALEEAAQHLINEKMDNAEIYAVEIRGLKK